MRKRIDEVEAILLELWPVSVVVDRMVEKYGVTDRTVRNWIAHVDERWMADRAEDREAAKARAIRRVFELMRKSTDEKFKLSCEHFIARIEGTFAPESSVSWTIDPDKITDEQISRILDGGEEPAVVLGVEASRDPVH